MLPPSLMGVGMHAIIRRTLKSLTQGYVLRYMVWTVLLTALGFALLMGGVTAVLHTTQVVKWSWLDIGLDYVLGASAMWVSWLLFPLMIPLLGALLNDAIAQTVEREEYGVEQAPSLPLWPQIRGAIGFVCKSLVLNALALVFLIFPPLWLAVYYALNGWLLGRDFFETVAVRHVLPVEASSLRWRAKLPIWLAGIGLVVLSHIPVVNLSVPFVAVVAMVHVFWAERGMSR
jgi:CysZ protein